jgi:hypothetical protein
MMGDRRVRQDASFTSRSNGAPTAVNRSVVELDGFGAGSGFTNIPHPAGGAHEAGTRAAR